MIRDAPARWWHLNGSIVECELCPHRCHLLEHGARGTCGLRYRSEDELRTFGWGGVATAQLDPIEKQPLYHFLPGSMTFSVGMHGCNLACDPCQNWILSTHRNGSEMPIRSTPQQIVREALQYGAASVSFSCNEPLISAEFWIEVAEQTRAAGLKTVAVTNGYAEPECASEFFSKMDAANVGLKGFSERFYREICQGRLGPVLHNLKRIRNLETCHLELTLLLIPSKNDEEQDLCAMSRWIRDQLGSETPLHLTAFHPDHKAIDWPPARLDHLHRACEIAAGEGLQNVYFGSVFSPLLSSTLCTACRTTLVEREGFQVRRNRITQSACPVCTHGVHGVF